MRLNIPFILGLCALLLAVMSGCKKDTIMTIGPERINSIEVTARQGYDGAKRFSIKNRQQAAILVSSLKSSKEIQPVLLSPKWTIEIQYDHDKLIEIEYNDSFVVDKNNLTYYSNPVLSSKMDYIERYDTPIHDNFVHFIRVPVDIKSIFEISKDSGCSYINYYLSAISQGNDTVKILCSCIWVDIKTDHFKSRKIHSFDSYVYVKDSVIQDWHVTNCYCEIGVKSEIALLKPLSAFSKYSSGMKNKGASVLCNEFREMIMTYR